MTITNMDIIAELERLAAAFPWQEVDIWVQRSPNGRYSFIAYLRENRELGIPSDCETGESPQEAVDKAIAGYAVRNDPEAARKKKLEGLQKQMAKLLVSASAGLPPYRPGRHLTDSTGARCIEIKETITV